MKVTYIVLTLLFLSCLTLATSKSCSEQCFWKFTSLSNLSGCFNKCILKKGKEARDEIIQRLDRLAEQLKRDEELEVSSDSQSGISAGATVCVKDGLNARWAPCGDVAYVTSGVKGVVVDTQTKTCLGGTFEWVYVETNGAKVWVANVQGSSIYRCGEGAERYIGKDQLKSLMPSLPMDKVEAYIGPLNDALEWGQMTTCFRISAFLAQIAHESIELRYFEEIASGAAYEGRTDIGNTQPGDGKRYKGRGPIQLTGRSNYRWAGKDLGVDLEGNPTLAATPEWGFKIASWFFTTRNLNRFSDLGTQEGFDKVTYRVNGGYRGKADRDRYWIRAKALLGC